MNILEAMRDPQLLGAVFPDLAPWRAWLVLLQALFALPMDPEAAATYHKHTGREALPTEPPEEAWLIVGRRGGKSRIVAAIAVYLAAFRDYTPHLAPGERATIPVLAADRRQARTIMRYVRAMLHRSPYLARMVEHETREAIDLTNRVTIEVHTASFRTVRGYTVVAALLEEVAFWPQEDSAEPDEEVVEALLPAMATIPGALLLGLSSPYAKRGVLWQAFRGHYGKDSPTLVWKASTREMHPGIRQRVIDRAMAKDPARAAAEYGAEFRDDIEGLLRREVVEACLVAGRFELPRQAGVEYVAFVDPSGGSSDSMTLAVAHREDGDVPTVVLDAVREVRPPFKADAVVRDFAELLKGYGITKARGDRYGGIWPAERFAAHGVTYEPAELTKSDLYREAVPVLNAGRVELLDVPRLAAQFCGLERRTARGGRDSIDHAPGGHDDVANAVAGVMREALGERKRGLTPEDIYGPTGPYALHAQEA